MIGSGIFLLPASLAMYGGISMVGWIVSSVGAVLLAKLFANLSFRIPKSGGPYIYTKEGFGDFAGFLVAWGYWISICATNAAIVVAMLSYLTVFLPVLSHSQLASLFLGLGVIWFLSWINTRGIRTAGFVQILTTILKITPLILIGVVGLFYIDFSHFEIFNISDKSNFQAITETATLTLFAFLGIECATIPASQVKDAQKTVPAATLVGTLLVVSIYVVSSFTVMGIVSPEVLQVSEAPFADAAMIMWGQNAMYWVALGAVISTFGALNGWILVQAQVPFAAAKDGLFPKLFAVTNKVASPAKGIVFSSILVSIILCFNYSKGFVKAFEFMILLGTLTALVPYLFSAATHILLSFEKGKKWTWVLGGSTFVFSMWAVIGSGHEVVFWGFISLMLSLPIYVFLKKDG